METLILNDQIYGSTEIKSPMLTDLLSSPSIQRLKGINQFGIPDQLYYRRNFSRFEHCQGVMLLLKHLGASELEQVAGLLHDASHRAFSHVYDWVTEDHTQQGPKPENTQDNNHQRFLEQTETPNVLTRHGYQLADVTDYHQFTLLESDTPALCADRVDYSLRELPLSTAQEILLGLTTFAGRIVCSNLDTAATFGREFLDLQNNHWGSFEAVTRYTYFSKTLKRAIQIGLITHQDFDLDDQSVLKKLTATSDEEIQQVLTLLKSPNLPLARFKFSN